MTKETIKTTLKKEYIVALSIFAEFINRFNDVDDREDALYTLDEIVWKNVKNAEIQEKWLRIYTALMTAIE